MNSITVEDDGMVTARLESAKTVTANRPCSIEVEASAGKPITSPAA